MAITPFAHQWLQRYVADAQASGCAHKATAKGAVVLTPVQHRDLQRALKALWGSQYDCPPTLDIKPQHGYRSRIDKDGFLPDDYVEWLVAGCSDVAELAVQANGRPFLLVPDIMGRWTKPFDLVVPVTSDAFGYVHVFDVIPKGLPGPKKVRRNKKTAPEAIP